MPLKKKAGISFVKEEIIACSSFSYNNILKKCYQ